MASSSGIYKTRCRKESCYLSYGRKKLLSFEMISLPLKQWLPQ